MDGSSIPVIEFEANLVSGVAEIGLAGVIVVEHDKNRRGQACAEDPGQAELLRSTSATDPLRCW